MREVIPVKDFFKAAWAVIGYIFGLIGTAVTIFTVSGSFTIENKWFIVITFFFISAIVIATMAVIKYKKIIKEGTRFKITAYGQEKGKDLYYTDYSSYLRVGTLVSIYYNNPISKILGYGIVCNSSPDEYIEIGVVHVNDELTGIFTQSKTNTQKVLKDMYILPNVYVENISQINDFLNGG